MDKPAIRIVNTLADDLARCNVEHVLRVFGEISQLPGKAKALRGLVFLGFPSIEPDPRPNWLIPEVRQFIRKLDSEMPHFCYFLTSEVPFGFLRIYMYCLLEVNQDGSVQPQAFEALVQRLEKDVRGFCDRIADRPEPVIERIMMNLPAQIVHNAPPLCRAALHSLLPVLEAIIRSPDASDQIKDLAFREAEELLGVTVSACGSEENLVARAREEAERRDWHVVRDIHTEQGRNELAYRVVKCFEMKEVPLIVATTRDQEVFVPWMAGVLGGRVIRSYDAFPLTRFLESLDHLDYVFLRLEGDVPDDLYLLTRDYALDREAPLIARLGPHAIHADHRLAIFIDSSTLAKLADDLAGVLSGVCTLRYESIDDAGEGAHQQRLPRVFDNAEAAIAWCDRYYANGRFLFRGQTRDWPLTAPIHRVSEAREHRREAQRTLDFVAWLISDNALLEGVKLSEDQALAVAQHHGLKTLLLDVSRSARIATFFATHGADPDANENGILYVFHEGDLRRYMTLDGELGEKLGRGLMEPKIDPLRRIRHQQGLFFESRPWLIQDLVLAKLCFRQKPRGVGIEEGFAPPREFIYPPLSSLERVVETYLLIQDAIGTAERELSEVHPLPDPSFDSAGLALRAFLDELDPKPVPPLQRPHQTLDAYAGMLALTCSHLLVHQVHYLSTSLEAGQLLRKDSLIPAMFREAKKHLCGAQNHMNKAHPTNIAEIPHLSIRDLVDGFAIYHDICSGNRDVTSTQFDYHLSTNYTRLRNAYACADHWLGDFAWEVFPVAAAFALNCRNPVRAYLDAVVEIGKHEGDFLTRYSAEEGAQILTQWTGHEPIHIDDIMRQVPLPVFHRRAIERLHAWREAHPDRVADLGPFLFKQRDIETVRELMPQFALHKDFEVRVLQHDVDLAETVYPLSAEISLFEGLAGLESTMRCHLEECPFHRFRICGRIPAIPPHPDSCEHRKNLEGSYKLTPERLEAFVAV